MLVQGYFPVVLRIKKVVQFSDLLPIFNLEEHVRLRNVHVRTYLMNSKALVVMNVILPPAVVKLKWCNCIGYAKTPLFFYRISFGFGKKRPSFVIELECVRHIALRYFDQLCSNCICAKYSFFHRNRLVMLFGIIRLLHKIYSLGLGEEFRNSSIFKHSPVQNVIGRARLYFPELATFFPSILIIPDQENRCERYTYPI